MIEHLLGIIPQSLIPWIIERWERKKTRAEAWLAFAEAHFNEVWAYQIYKNSNQCSPRVVRFAYGCRWDPISIITASHKTKGRVVIDGHFSYLVREDLAVQSRSFAYDRALLRTLIDDKVLRKGIGYKRLSDFATYLNIYFSLGHREFFETFLGKEFWASVGIPNCEYKKLIDGKGQLNIDKYEQLVCNTSYQDTIEYKLITTQKDRFLKNLRATEIDQYDVIQPNTIFGGQNKLIEYNRGASLLNLFLREENGNGA